MADNYCQSSTMLAVPPNKMGLARQIIDREVKTLKDGEEGYCDVKIDIEQNGVWFHNHEHFDPTHCEVIARALIEELELDETFVCSYAYTCSKERLDKFGGGAFAIKRGRDTVWVDAALAAWDIISN